MSTDTSNLGKVVRDVWMEQLLMSKQLAGDANFFELGGNSLLAAAVVGKLSHLYQVSLSLGLLARNPTLEGFADAVRTEVEKRAK